MRKLDMHEKTDFKDVNKMVVAEMNKTIIQGGIYMNNADDFGEKDGVGERIGFRYEVVSSANVSVYDLKENTGRDTANYKLEYLGDCQRMACVQLKSIVGLSTNTGIPQEEGRIESRSRFVHWL